MTYDRSYGRARRRSGLEGAEPALGLVNRERRLSDKVADMMLETILSIVSTSATGSRPSVSSESKLGVSRTVVREAIRALVTKGVIDVRSGSGLRVAAVDANAVSESMSLFLRGGTLDFEKARSAHRPRGSPRRPRRRARDRRRRRPAARDPRAHAERPPMSKLLRATIWSSTAQSRAPPTTSSSFS